MGKEVALVSIICLRRLELCRDKFVFDLTIQLLESLDFEHGIKENSNK